MPTTRHVVLVAALLSLTASQAFALKGVLISAADKLKLKKDLLEGKISIGKTRLTNIQNEYGEAPNINDDDKSVTYDYGDLRLTFERERFWKSWEKDSFRRPVYTDDVDDLRFDLESGELVGDNITFQMIRRSYGEPTESFESDGDGGNSVYYYGDIKMVFENVISVKSWRGANLGEGDSSRTSGDVYKSAAASPPPAPVAVTSDPSTAATAAGTATAEAK
jgi:hypothetical protein